MSRERREHLVACPGGQVEAPVSSDMPRDLAITFAGGGSRSFYQVGLLDRWGERLRPRLAAVAGVSAGACTAAVWLAGRTEATRSYWHWRRRDVHSNFEWRRLLQGERPTPQGPVYRDSMVHAFREGGLEALADALARGGGEDGVFAVAAEGVAGLGVKVVHGSRSSRRAGRGCSD